MWVYNRNEKESLKKELTTLKEIMQLTNKPDNILTPFAILESDTTYSLFFDRAECDLWDYFTNSAKAEVSLGQTRTLDLEQKKTLFGQTVGLAEASEYLHGQARIKDTGDTLILYHLDFKPQSILVFIGKEGIAQEGVT
ncbi:hypothetical protein OEA41_007517 [Lepraria neglecta]|uniref:Protein kinase domain-containing protein n=1 Tax=Lepraria neglecta TaxID=209136 RepID=A0AAD9ZFM3_9LECA|nr:hypothetical protein OEA41_007517 [Lepraria neglecta]